MSSCQNRPWLLLTFESLKIEIRKIPKANQQNGKLLSSRNLTLSVLSFGFVGLYWKIAGFDGGPIPVDQEANHKMNYENIFLITVISL